MFRARCLCGTFANKHRNVQSGTIASTQGEDNRGGGTIRVGTISAALLRLVQGVVESFWKWGWLLLLSHTVAIGGLYQQRCLSSFALLCGPSLRRYLLPRPSTATDRLFSPWCEQLLHHFERRVPTLVWQCLSLWSNFPLHSICGLMHPLVDHSIHRYAYTVNLHSTCIILSWWYM